MEDVFSVEQEIVSPFPEAETSTGTGGGLLLYHHHQLQVQSEPEPAGLTCSLPAQKLRPIRPNSKPTSLSETEPHPRGFVLESQSQDMGNDCQPKGEFIEVKDDLSAMELVKIKSEMDAHFISTLKSQFSHPPFSSFSSSSDASGESAAAAEKPEDWKPKRNKRKKVELFLESLMAKVIHKQEQMHHQLMDMIERRERERITREQAWRQQELERAKEEEEIRSQQAARSLALISLIHKALAHPLPQRQAPTYQCDPDNKRWPMSELQALITLLADPDHKFHSLGSKAPAWQQVSAAMASMGYIRDAKSCKETWDNINKFIKQASQTPNSFHELKTFHRNQLIATTNANSPTNIHFPMEKRSNEDP